MRPTVREELLRINRAFYQSLAGPFASTRPRVQPGVRSVLSRIEPQADVLDVGCGHGLAAEELQRLGFRGTYRGVDSSDPLIEIARHRVNAPWATFDVADLALEGWAPPSAVDWLLAFAVLHHVPDAVVRQRLVHSLGSTLRRGGTIAVSVWDFGDAERFRRKMVPWAKVGLQADDVEPGDVLIDWRHGGRGVRYIHRFTSEELEGLAKAAGLTVVEEFHSDGDGGRMGLYQVWGLR